jgi:hypothetical protein
VVSNTTSVANRATAANVSVELARISVPSAGLYFVTANATVSRSTTQATGLACRYGTDAAAFKVGVIVPQPNGSTGGILALDAPVQATSDGAGGWIVRLVCDNQAKAATFTWSVLLTAFPIGAATGYVYNG